MFACKSTAQEFFNGRHHDKYKFMIILILVLNEYILRINNQNSFVHSLPEDG